MHSDPASAPRSHAEGFVYVATGDAYYEEARRSAASVRLHHPTRKICLVTDRVRGEPFWDDLVLLPNPDFGFRDKMHMGLSPYARSLFLDTDTEIIGPLDDVFVLLERFELAAHQLFEGHDYAAPGVPDIFPDFNTGVIAFRRSPETEAFFKTWRRLYDEYFARNTPGNYRYENVSDQQSFRVAAYESGLRLAVLGPEYNFVPHHVNFACASVRVLHGRGDQNLSNLKGRLNIRLGNRTYIPRLDTILSNDPIPSELFRACGMGALQLLRIGFRRVTPLWLRNLARRVPSVRSLFLRNRFAPAGAKPAKKWRQPFPPASS